MSANQIACAFIWPGAYELHSKAGYIGVRPACFRFTDLSCNAPPVLTAAAVAPNAAETAKVSPAQSESKAQKSGAEMRKFADEQYKQCLNNWDAYTHMTKKEWQRTCRRLKDTRMKLRLRIPRQAGH